MTRFIGIDPASKTGFVALDQDDNVLVAKDLTGVGTKDPKRIGSLVDEIMRHIEPNDIICIEGFSFGSKGRGVSFQYGLGYMIRDRLYRMKMGFTEVSPGQLKKFATGKGNTKKDAMAVPIYKRWGFDHSSDNVRDAYVLAQIAKGLHEANTTGYIKKTPIYQGEVIEAIMKGA